MKIRAFIPIFHVQDVSAASEYYTRVLGFTETFRYGTYVWLIIGAGTAYVICDEIDAYFASIKAAGATPRSEPKDRIYGMRDFAVLDPDGNQLTFGCDLD
jgi:uncharacterized glyoxalase superfamily protein PhnB